jgi:hypothetical protein
MRNTNPYQSLMEIITALLILLFVYTGLSKLHEHDRFVSVLFSSPLIGHNASLFAWTLPVVELATAILLLVPFTRLAGLFTSLVLMSIFTVYIAYMLLTSSHLPCSCGGVLKSMTWPQHLIFNILFTLLCVMAIWFYGIHKRFIAINRLSRTPVQESRRNIDHLKL